MESVEDCQEQHSQKKPPSTAPDHPSTAPGETPPLPPPPLNSECMRGWLPEPIPRTPELPQGNQSTLLPAGLPGDLPIRYLITPMFSMGMSEG